MNDPINIPEHYIPKTEPEKPIGQISFLSYDIMDLYREIVELIPSIILILMLPWLSKSYFDDQSFIIGFFYSFLFCIIAF